MNPIHVLVAVVVCAATSGCATITRGTNDVLVVNSDPVEMDVMSQIAGAGAAGMAGNVLLGGLIGASADAATGRRAALR